MHTFSKAIVIQKAFDAYRRGERALIESVLADDFHFTSPYDDHLDRATYFEHCWPGHTRMRAILIEEIWDRGDEAVVLYRVTTHDGAEFRNMELHKLRGDKIKEVQVFFGASHRNGVFAPLPKTA